MSRVLLREFRPTNAGLSRDEQLVIVRQALRLLRSLYVHSLDESAAYYSAAVSRLEDIEMETARGLPERAFHDQMIAAFKLLRDRHAHYLLPKVFRGQVAFLPCLIGEYFEGDDRRYCVTLVDPGEVADSQFGVGVTLTHWNGIPIAEEIERLAESEDGAHPAARHARALAALTIRPAWLLPLPLQDTVTLTYSTGAESRETTLEWKVGAANQIREAHNLLDATDSQSEAIDQFIGQIFADRRTRLETAVQKAFGTTNVGYLRLTNFFVYDDEFVAGFIAFLKQQSRQGVVIDIRGNPGGWIPAGERSLQLLGERTIEPTRWEFRATPETLALCRGIRKFEKLPAEQRRQFAAYIPSLTEALNQGLPTSAALHATSADAANDLERAYYGPVLLITDALTYSVGDLFASGFQDHELGGILGVDPATGAGGSNDLTYELISWILPETFAPLPQGASFRISVRRCRRVGKQAGVLIEKLGVSSDHLHKPTRDDRLQGDKDLIGRAVTLLRT